jgi:hypothetical protein
MEPDLDLSEEEMIQLAIAASLQDEASQGNAETVRNPLCPLKFS